MLCKIRWQNLSWSKEQKIWNSSKFVHVVVLKHRYVFLCVYLNTSSVYKHWKYMYSFSSLFLFSFSLFSFFFTFFFSFFPCFCLKETYKNLFLKFYLIFIIFLCGQLINSHSLIDFETLYIFMWFRIKKEQFLKIILKRMRPNQTKQNRANQNKAVNITRDFKTRQ